MADDLSRNDRILGQRGSSQPQTERHILLGDLDRFRSSPRRSIVQFSITLTAYIATLAAMYAALHVSVWLSMALVLPAAGLVVRLFIIQHDCGHASYFRSRHANEFVGRLCSLVTFTPYANWRRQHARHHAVWNNLDQRDTGLDIYVTCITLNEYLTLSPRGKWLYRLRQHPIVTQFLIPPLVFLLLFRLPFDTPKTWRQERRGVYLTNVALAVILGVLIACFGWQTVLVVHLPIMILASTIGIWLFAVQHRFEDTEWLRQENWTAVRASLNGTSHLHLPAIFHWFTGNIGFHHVHHLLPRIPNYHLLACHDVLQSRSNLIRTLTLRDALRAPTFVLWDEARSRMVPFPARG